LYMDNKAIPSDCFFFDAIEGARVLKLLNRVFKKR